MEVGMIQKVDIDQEMQQSYLDYAMSVIVARALPDARDGLKPVQRRILYAMYDMGLRSEATYKKSARIVGEVLGKYHPHGDMAVYESMARLAQDFTMRYCLVDGQGNFGSVDGDPPAAMRYTEARLTPFAMELLNQIDRDTVDFSPNFDGTLKEPDVLPSAIPNLLVNGASGIAVGMATNIPPHNLGEVVDALVLLLREWERMDDIAISDLMRFIQGPDLPTGGILMEEEGMNDLQSAYATGRGRVLVRGRVQSEDMGRGKSRLIVTELPYQVNKSSLIERIAELVREGGLEGISDLRDESDRQGMRIVIELNKAAETERVLLELYKRTPLQSTLSFNMLALVNGEPRLLSLKQALRVYLEHRLTIVKRRSEYDLAKAQHRLHILEGLRVALKNLDEVISLIRSAPDVDAARERLMKRFKLTEIQAQAILEMQLRRLASLERKKIDLEYKEVSDLIKQLEGILKSPRKIRQVVEEDLLAVKTAFADRRRTQIVSLKDGSTAKTLLTTNDLTPAHAVWVGVMEDGHVGRTIGDALPRVSGKDAPRCLIRATTHHTLYLVTEDGRAAAISIESLPEVERFADGASLHKVSPLDENDIIASVFSIPPARSERSEEHFVLTVSRLGMVKKSAIVELPGPSAQVFVLAKVNSGDSIGWAHITGGENELLLISAQGMGIRFHESEVRAMGLPAVGVNGIKLAAADYLVAVELTAKEQELLIMAGNGKAWRLPVDEFPLQGRYGQGVQICKLERGVKLVGMLSGKKNTTGILHLRIGASRLLRVDEIELTKRLRIGQEAVTVKTSDQVEEITTMRDSLSLWGEEKSAPEKKSTAEPVAKPKKVTAAKTGSAVPAPTEAPKRGRRKKAETAAPSPAVKTKPVAVKTDATVKKTQKAAPAKSEQKKSDAPRKTAKAEAQPSLPLGKEGESKPQTRARKPRTATGGKEKGTGK